jgi:glycosyltransferase involved in cell wall biosynthesis
MSQHRILIITNRMPYPLNDGGNLAMHAMITGYHKAGWQVQVLAMNTTRHYVDENEVKKLYAGIDGLTTVSVDNNITLTGTLRNFFFSKQPNHAERFYHASFAKKLDEVIQQFNPTVVQIESVFLSSYLPIIERYTNIIKVLRLHNIEYQIWNRLANENTNPFKKYYLRNLAQRIEKYEKNVWAKFDLLLPITQVDAACIQNSNIHKPIVVAPYGIELKNIHEAHTERWDGYHIGAMDWLPNAEAISWFLKEVWTKLHKEIPEFQFYYAGRNMPAHFTKLQIEGTHCMGEVTDATTFIADKKILIVPLLSGGGIRVKILEAMAAGKVVISTDIGMQGMDAKNGIHYKAANTAEEFIAAVKWCLQHKHEAETIGKTAAEWIKTAYSQPHIMANITHQLETMIS